MAILSTKFGQITAGGTFVTLKAQANGDNTNAGVVWTLTANGAPCANDCGFLSAVTPISATYTPPAGVPASPTNAPTITATAVADSTKSDSDSFTIIASAITVTITNKVNAVTAGPLGITFTASTQNDSSNKGVSWGLSLPGGATCTAATCGTITIQNTVLANYQPPTSAPASPVTISATSIASPQSASDSDVFAIVNGPVSTCAGTASGNESLLNGRYAFFAQGTSVMAASFAADGKGRIQDLGGGVGGEIDINDGNSPRHFTVTSTPANPTTPSSLYTVGSDNTGCLSLYTSNGTTTIFRFALGKVSSGVATEGRITEFDDQFASTSTEGTRASGPLRLQDPAAFASGNTSQLQRNYAFGVGGSGGSGDPHAVVVGAFVLDPATGLITNSDFDSDDLSANPGVVQSDVQGGTGSIGSVSTKTGRAILTFAPKSATWPGGTIQTQAALYVVNSSELFLVTADSPNLVIGSPIFLYAGRAIATGASFNSAALSGSFILHETGTLALSACNQCADVSLGLLNFASGNSSVFGTIFEYNATNGPTTPPITLLGSATYAVSSTFGRVSLTGTGLAHPPVFYIAQPTTATETIQAFAGGTDPSGIGASGVLEPGASANVLISSLAGKNYFLGDEDDPDDSTIANRVGVASISASGAMTGTQFTSASGLLSFSSINRTVVIDNANGPGTGNVGANTVAITNGSKLFFIDETSGAPASIIVVEPQ